jgi:putative ABC transport system permease protein
VRVALGASRFRLARQLFTEGLLVAVAGTAGGLLVARSGTTAFFKLLPETAWSPLTRFRDDVQLNGTILTFAVLLSAVTTIVLTLTPVVDSLKLVLAESLRAGQRTSRNSREHRVYKVLVASQFACAIVLLVGAGLLIQSFSRMQRVDRGFDPDRLFLMGLPLAGRNPQTFVEQVLERIKAIPGVESAAVKSGPRFDELNFPINFERALPQGDVVVRYTSATADYFTVLKARLLAGRMFDARDNASSRGVVIVNETLARQHFPDRNPIGERIVLAYNNQRMPLEIVGVVSQIKPDAPGEPLRAQVFAHWPQIPWIGASVLVRASGDPAAVQAALRQATTSVDNNLPSLTSRAAAEILAAQVATPRLYTVLVGVFAAAAVALAALGLYGLFAYIVGRRTNEIAIRVALGGQRSSIVRMVVAEGLQLSLAGITIGLVGAIALARVLRSLLFEVSPADPMTLSAVVTLLGLVAMAACYIPARRAATTNPLIALRRE